MVRETQRNVVGIGARVAIISVAVLVLVPLLTRPAALPRHREATTSTVEPPIPGEAEVFRTASEDLAVAPATEGLRPARRRTLEGMRALRAYPGAPPRIPHALTEDEFRLTRCTNCHARGGFAPRFGAYTPVTPHPEYRSCLQCHVPEQTASDFVASDWRTVEWPAVGRRAMEGSPPWIPHDFHLRGNCLTCHGGPSAVVEIRTTHPERANCRQCHVPAGSASEEDTFTRPVDGAALPPGGGR